MRFRGFRDTSADASLDEWLADMRCEIRIAALMSAYNNEGSTSRRAGDYAPARHVCARIPQRQLCLCRWLAGSVNHRWLKASENLKGGKGREDNFSIMTSLAGANAYEESNRWLAGWVVAGGSYGLLREKCSAKVDFCVINRLLRNKLIFEKWTFA